MRVMNLISLALKKYRADIAAVALVALAAVTLAGKPAINVEAIPAARITPETPPVAAPKEVNSEPRPLESAQAIRQRNIFAASGAYTEATGQTLPENPYALVAVLRGGEKKAVFREHTGNIVTAAAGRALVDGFVVARIDDMSVLLKRRDEQKELRLFNIEGRLPPPALDTAGAKIANLYTLIGILGGERKKAAFRDYRGSVAILGVGARLIDGAVITAIDASSVRLRKDNEQTEMRIFDIKSSEQAVRKK